MNYFSFFKGGSGITHDYVWQLVFGQIELVSSFLVLFLMISIGYNLIITILKSKGKTPINTTEIIRVCVIIFMIPFYASVMAGLHSIIEIILHSASSYDYDKSAFVNAHLKAIVDKEVIEESKTIMDHVGDIFNHLVGSFYSIVGTATSIGGMGISFILRGIILGLISNLGNLFLIIGPWAFAFSTLPGQEKKLGEWFNVYLTILITPLIYMLIREIELQTLYYNFKGVVLGGVSAGEGSALVTTSLVTIVMYTLPFWIAGKIIGSGSAGQFLSQTMQLASVAMSGGVSKAIGALKKIFGGKGGGAMGNVADTAKKSMDAD